MPLEFQRTDGVSDALDGVRLPVSEVVHRVDDPVVAGAVVGRLEDAVQHRVAQVQVGRGHVDFGPQHAAALVELPGPHPLEQVKVLAYGALAVGAFPPRLGQGAAVLADFVKGEVVHVGPALADEVNGHLVELVEVVGGRRTGCRPSPNPASATSLRMELTYSTSSRVGLVSSKRILQWPPFSAASPKLRQADLACPMCR